MQKGLNKLLEKYSVNEQSVIIKDEKSLLINGKVYPLLPWESERRFIEMRNLVLNGRLGNMSTCRIGHTTKKGEDLMDLLAREIGVLEFIVNSSVIEIFAIAGKNTMNCIAETRNGCVCTIELGATLGEGQKQVDKHEIITDNGVACDRAVDTQVPQESIYVFGKNEQTFIDTDAELYGYNQEQINVIRNAFSLAKNQQLRLENVEKWAHIKRVVAAAQVSLERLENVEVEVL